ncbi:hypothetical protein OG520_02905 [Streptomyces sp. NBC_00984]|uniref:hypothetical protein n=1 Tax=Streptomyces sp. NBC_00984 TaxID=2903700 RepID=UPI00386D17FB|nr:hypothetical protein OG520_02905 [Streptomyces sp. NBC_00984]
MPRAGRTGAAVGRSVPASGPAGAVWCDAPCCTAAVVVTGVADAEVVAGRIPAMCRSAIAGRLAMIRGGAVRRGRTAAGRARWGETGAGAAPAGCRDADAAAGLEAGPGAAAGAVPFAGAASAVASGAVAPPPPVRCPGAPLPEEREDEERGGEAGAGEGREDTVRLARWTVVVAGAGFAPALPLPTSLPAAADGRPAAGSASPSVPVRAARNSSGPPGDSERALPGRATPWMRPTGADGSTAWPSSLPKARSCHEARPSLNRSPSLTPIEDRATVTVGGATCRQPPSQSPPPTPSR